MSGAAPMDTEEAAEYPPLTCWLNCREAFSIAESRWGAQSRVWNAGAQEWEPTIQLVLERADTQPLYDQLAPRLVWGDARGAAIMRTKNRSFRMAIDASIVEWTRTFNNVFVHAQKTVRFAAGARPEDLPNDPAAFGVFPPTAEQIAERTKLQEQWDAATNDQTALRLLVSRAFDYGGNNEASQRLMKSLKLLPVEDPRPKPIPPRPPPPPPFPVPADYTAPPEAHDDERYQYVVAKDISFYLAFAEDRCQIHAHAPRAVRHVFQGSCAVNEEALGLVQVPAIYDVGLCMYGCPTCMSRMCCGLNIMSENPFELDRPKEESSMSTLGEAPAWHYVPRYENMKLAKSLARHVGVGAPFSSGRLLAHAYSHICAAPNAYQLRNQIAQLFEKHAIDDGPQVTRAPGASRLKRARRLAGAAPNPIDPDSDDEDHERLRGLTEAGEFDAVPGVRAKSRERARSNRPVFMFDHRGLVHPNGKHPLVTLQTMLGFGEYELQLALADVREERISELETRALVRQRHCALLQGQFARLCIQDPTGRDEERHTIAALDVAYPGVRVTMDLVMGNVDFCQFEHILDIGFAPPLVKGIGMMTGPLSSWDKRLSGQQASGHAYCYVTGMSAGLLPGITPSQIAERLNLDAVEDRLAPPEIWESLVRAMWVFDATLWNRVGIRAKTMREHAGASTSAPSRNTFEWHVGVGDQITVGGMYEPLFRREDWVAIRRRAVERTADYGWSANWPKVPEEAELLTLQPEHDGPPSKRALNYIVVTAQQLIAWPKTRAQGLEVLTGNNLRGFIHACSETPIDIGSLVAFAALEGAQNEEPQTDDEEVEG